VKISAHQLSEILNTQLNQNFYAFLNGYRIEEAKRLLRDQQHLSIAAIAYEVGYNSHSSLYHHFRKITGVSPGEYRNSIAKSSD